MFKPIHPFTISIFLLFSAHSSGQVKELEQLRKDMTLFVNYDNGKIDSLPKSAETTKRLKSNYENSFMAFVKHKDSRNLDSLKKRSIDNKTSFIIGNNSYFFSNLRKDLYVKSLENNVNYQVTFYGLYDYKLPNFVSFYIQPFNINNAEYLVYYCKLNGKGTYYIKEASTNQIVFQAEGITSNAPVKKFMKIDAHHFLVVEDLDKDGERAYVIKTSKNKWEIVDAFKGKGFRDNVADYSKKTELPLRTYLKFITPKSTRSMYGEFFLKKYEISFDETTQMIAYKRYNKTETDVKEIKARWDGNAFNIDDYYLGEDLESADIPKPY